MADAGAVDQLGEDYNGPVLPLGEDTGKAPTPAATADVGEDYAGPVIPISPGARADPSSFMQDAGLARMNEQIDASRPPISVESAGSFAEASKQRNQQLAELDRQAGGISTSNYDFDTAAKHKEDNPLMRGAFKGAVNLQQQSLGLRRFYGELTGDKQLADDMAAEGARMARMDTAVGEGKTDFEKNIVGATNSIVSQLPGLAAGVATGGSTIPLAGMFVGTFGQEYENGRSNGKTMGEATTRAGLYGAAEVLGELYAVGPKIKAILGAAHGVETGKLSEHLAHMLLAELPGEQATTLMEFLIDKSDKIGLSPQATLADYLQQVGQTFTQTITQSAMMGGATAGIKVGHHVGTAGAQTLNAGGIAEAEANAARDRALAKGQNFLGLPQQAPATAAPATAAPAIPDQTAPAGIDPLTLQPIQQGHPEAPRGLPSPGQMPITSDQLGPGPTEASTAVEQHAAATYAARDAEEARQRALAQPATPSQGQPTAGSIALDQNDPAGSIAAIAAAPVTEVRTTPVEPQGIDQKAHAEASGDLAASMLHIAQLEREAKVTPKAQRGAIEAQIEQIRNEARQNVADYAGQYGEAAANHLRTIAAQTFHALKGDYRTLVQPAATFTGQEQPTGVNNASAVRGNEGQVRQGGTEGQPGVQPGAVQGGGNLQQPAPQGAGNGPAGDRGQRNVQEVVPVEGRLKAVPPIQTEVDRAAHQAAASPTNGLTPPTAEQAKAGNYQMGHQTFEANGMSVSFENPAGSIREDKHNVPPRWRSQMDGVHYGYWKRTEAADLNQKGQPQKLDVMVKNGTPANWNGPVFVVDQINPKTGAFDEHKTIVGAANEAEARDLYQRQYPKGWKGLGSISQTTMQGLKTWARFGDQTKPYAERRLTPEEAATPKQAKISGPAQPIHNSVVRSAIRASVGDIRGSEHIVLDKAPQRLLDAVNVYRSLTLKEHPIVAAIVKDTIAAGVPEVAFAGIMGTHVYPTDIAGHAHIEMYASGDYSIGIRQDVMDAIANGDHNWGKAAVPIFIHEVAHSLNNSPGITGVKAATDKAAGFDTKTSGGIREVTGDVVKEMYDAYKNSDNAQLRDFLSYPFGFTESPKLMPDSQFKDEAFAQAMTLGYTQPKLLEDMPATKQLFERVRDAINAVDKSGNRVAQATRTREAVSRAIRGASDSVQPRAATSRGADQGYGNRFDYGERVSTVRNAEAGVGQSDESVALAKASKSLTEEEKPRVKSEKMARQFLAILRAMPSSEEAAAIAWAGRAKRGWYRKSALALHHVFGIDAPRFAQLLAAMSPQTSVESNLENALRTWVNWVDAGRPQSHSAIKEVMGRSVQGNKLSDSVLDAWVNNSIRALTAPLPAETKISGPKVNSFFLNLIGVTNEVTNDSWMAAYANVSQTLFGGTRDNPLGPPVKDEGKGVGYLAMSVVARQAAAKLTKFTGETWTPAEVQETIWSWAKALSEFSSKDMTAVDIVKNKTLTDELINATPDFGSLLEEGTYADILRKAGGEHAAGVARLAEANRESARAAEGGATSTQGQKAPFAPATQQKHEVAAAKRLDLRREGAVPQFTPLAERLKMGDITVKNGAVFDDFREDPAAAAQKPGWAMMSAVRSSKTDAQNAAAQDNFESFLTKHGIEFHPIKGVYNGQSEDSFLIFVKPDIAAALGKKYKQESVATSEGLVFTDGSNMVLPWNHDATIVGPEAAKGDHTVLPDGTSFSLQLAPERKTASIVATQLEGLPGSSPGPNQRVHEAAVNYMAASTTPYIPPTKYVKVDVNYSKKIADAYEAMKHDPNDPEVKKAYAAMIDETVKQWHAMMDTGIKIDFTSKDNPYPYKSPMDVVRDVRDNNHMTVFSTDEGFGTSEADVSGNPLLEKTDIVVDGKTLLANDVFRAVHDFFGHAKDGVGFRADGEENAWRSHAAMFSNLARRAMTTETRGQNSWLNYGPHGETNRTAKTEDTIFADQKTGLLPEEFSTDLYENPDRAPVAGAGNVFVTAIEAETGREVRIEMPATEAIKQYDTDVQNIEGLLKCLSS